MFKPRDKKKITSSWDKLSNPSKLECNISGFFFKLKNNSDISLLLETVNFKCEVLWYQFWPNSAKALSLGQGFALGLSEISVCKLSAYHIPGSSVFWLFPVCIWYVSYIDAVSCTLKISPSFSTAAALHGGLYQNSWNQVEVIQFSLTQR